MSLSKSLTTTNEELTEYFIKKYAYSNKPITVSFKTLYPKLNNMDRFTHLIHPYPAKLLVHIPFFFLNNLYFSNNKDLVLDPFCGTGTVLLESLISGRNSIGADANPLAQIIAQVKVNKLETKTLLELVPTIVKKAESYKRYEIPDVVNIDLWFPVSSQISLSKILKAINEIDDSKIKMFFEVCFSTCVKKVSLADPRIAVPVKLNPERFPPESQERKRIKNRLSELNEVNVFDKFASICFESIKRIKTLEGLDVEVESKVISSDARVITQSLNQNDLLDDESVNLILTSPPYAGAQKYIRSSSLSLGWLGLAKANELRYLDKKNIGRENYRKHEIEEIETNIVNADLLLKKVFKINKTRAFIVGNYLKEMLIAIDEAIRVLKKGGFLIIVIGNNQVCNYEFNTQDYLTTYLLSKGLNLQFKLIDDIKSYGLMTKRNKTASIISREWILVLKK